MLYNGFVNKFARNCGVVFIICVLLASTGGHVAAQQGAPTQYFPSTAHNVSGEFWTYYQSIPNASYVFGAPITEQFTDAQSGRLVQYFQRARFEYYPENPSDQHVKLTALGSYVFQHSKPEGTLDMFTPIGCRFYADTGFSLCYAFLEFFDRNGGESIFGKPTTPFVFYNGRIVQYFERARFEWFPENADGEKVVLAELGRIYFDIVPEDANRLQAVRAENTPGDVRELFPRAFTWKAVTRLDDSQAVYVLVQDQTFNPVAGATAVVTISWPQGGAQSLALTTNELGLVTVPLQVQGQPHGSLVLIDVEVIYQGLSKKTQTSFRVWQ
jgi:hypothetical protein